MNTKIKILVDGIPIGKRKRLTRWVDAEIPELPTEAHARECARRWLTNSQAKLGWKDCNPAAFGEFKFYTEIIGGVEMKFEHLMPDKSIQIIPLLGDINIQEGKTI